MVFSSILFLFYFLPVVFLFYYIVPFRLKNAVCLVASLFFYAWGEPIYIALMLFSILVNYLFGRIIGGSERPAIRSAALAASCAVNLGALVFFKYSAFLIDSFNSLFKTEIFSPEISLPIGISFFTFQAMSYVVDVYRRETPAQKKITHLALYIAAFPQLIAGPIVRYADIAAQLSSRVIDTGKIASGVTRFIIGLSKKVLIANTMAIVADEVFSTGGLAFSTATAWLGLAAYTFQIYFDFSGYSDMAIGLGRMLGFEFMENFNYPYISKSITEFWRRWHISLGSWFRDYLYIPLGGNRKGLIMQLRNIAIVWVATGLWHGANWTFVVWGAFFGLLLVAEKFLLPKTTRVPAVFGHIYTLAAVAAGWVFFRSDSLSQAILYFKRLAGFGAASGFDSAAALYLHDYGPIFLIAALGSTPLVRDAVKRIFTATRLQKSPAWICVSLCLTALFSLCVVFLVNSVYNPFIYFRF